ncbi:P-loop containing nucleoside triphosphate hydrolase protein [Zopfochytrium polystomum]|nr:P-loop containing nucleoside triphosphate hydrolase protein [Zopfochytrium polystomum]
MEPCGAKRAALRVEGIGKDVDGTKLFGKKLTVLKDLWFSANVGECFGFLGPNGAGKSTTIRILTGQEPPTSGTAHLPPYTANHPITALTPYPHARLRSHIGLCPQHDALWDKLTPRDHVWLFGVIRGVVAVPTSLLGWLRRGKRQTDEEVETWLEKVAIATADRDVLSQKLSGGNRRRLMLAVAAVGRPRVLFLDEPTTGVDVAVRRSIWSAIQDLKKTSCVVLTTHSMEEADALSTRIGILVAGRLRCLGSPQRLKSVYSSGYTVTMHPPTAAAASTRQDAASAAAAAELAGEATARRLAAAIVARAAGLGLAAGTADAVTATPERGVGSVWVVRVGWAAAAAIVGADLLAGDGDGGSRDRAMAVRALTLLEAIHAAIEDRGAWAADATDAGDVGVAQTTLKQVFNEFSKRGDALQNATN